MKKTSSRLYKGTLLLLVMFLLVGCGAKDSGGTDSSSPEYAQMDVDTAGEGNWDYDYSYEDGELSEDSIEETESPVSEKDDILYESKDKIIRKINLSLETKNFDDLVKSIETQVRELDGYIETSRLTGRHYESDNLRYGTIIARIPKESVDGFVSNLGGIANIISKEENVENVTLQYVDLESRTEALEIEQERLLKLLERAEDIDDIISLEARLTSVRYELQSLKTQTRTIDNQVDFSTILVDIQEVRLMSSGIDSEDSILDRISRGTKKTFTDIKDDLADLLVWFIVNLPYIIIWLLVIFIIVLLIRKGNRKYRERNTSRDFNRRSPSSWNNNFNENNANKHNVNENHNDNKNKENKEDSVRENNQDKDTK